MRGVERRCPKTVAAAVSVAGVALLAWQLASAGAGAAPRAHAAKVAIAQQTFQMTGADERSRFTVICPKGKIPLGGGMIGSPAPGPAGEGVYPHSYERLGVQHGYHVSAVNLAPSQGNPAAHNVTLQVVCTKKLGPMSSPHNTMNVASGETKTAIATCSGKRHLIGGGFQRTNFTSRGGDYVTESRAISPKSWQVTGTAFGGFGGEMTAIAYCQRSKKPLLSTVSSTATIPEGQYANTITPPCPKRRKLVFGGFSTTPAGSTFFTDGSLQSGGWMSGGFNKFGPGPATLTAFGYCAKV